MNISVKKIVILMAQNLKLPKKDINKYSVPKNEVIDYLKNKKIY